MYTFNLYTLLLFHQYTYRSDPNNNDNGSGLLLLFFFEFNFLSRRATVAIVRQVDQRQQQLLVFKTI